MESRGEGEKDDDEIRRRKIKSITRHRGEQYHPDSDDLNKRAQLPEPRWFESAKAGHDIYRTGDRDDENIAANDRGRDPERKRVDDGPRGKTFGIVKITNAVVIRSLSAIGSMIVPSSDS
jgi:hypothetical protein